LWRIYYFITGRKIRRIMTKTAKAAVNAPELRVLCNFCSIRIAPNEEQVEMDRKTYISVAMQKQSLVKEYTIRR